jgi:hypothetical protein
LVGITVGVGTFVPNRFVRLGVALIAVLYFGLLAFDWKSSAQALSENVPARSVGDGSQRNLASTKRFAAAMCLVACVLVLFAAFNLPSHLASH